MGHSFDSGSQPLFYSDRESQELRRRLGEKRCSSCISGTSAHRNSATTSQNSNEGRAAGNGRRDEENEYSTQEYSAQLMEFFRSEPPPEPKRSSFDGLVSSGSFLKRRLRQSLRGRQHRKSDLSKSTELKRTHSGASYRAIKVLPEAPCEVVNSINGSQEHTRQSEEFPIRTVSRKGGRSQGRREALTPDGTRGAMPAGRQSPLLQLSRDERLPEPRLVLQFEKDDLDFETAYRLHTASAEQGPSPRVGDTTPLILRDNPISDPAQHFGQARPDIISRDYAIESKQAARVRSVHFSAASKTDPRYGLAMSEASRSRPTSSKKGSPRKSIILKPEPIRKEGYEGESPTRAGKRHHNDRFPVRPRPANLDSSTALEHLPMNTVLQNPIMPIPTNPPFALDATTQEATRFQQGTLLHQHALSSNSMSPGPLPLFPLPPMPNGKPDIERKDAPIHRGTSSSPIILDDPPSTDTPTPSCTPRYNTPCTSNSPMTSPHRSPTKGLVQTNTLPEKRESNHSRTSATSSTSRNVIAVLSQENVESIKNTIDERALDEPVHQSLSPLKEAMNEATSHLALHNRTLSTKALKQKHVEAARARKRNSILQLDCFSGSSSDNRDSYQSYSPTRTDSYRRNQRDDRDTLASSDGTDGGEDPRAVCEAKREEVYGKEGGSQRNDGFENGISPLSAGKRPCSSGDTRRDSDISKRTSKDLDDDGMIEDTDSAIIHLPSPDDTPSPDDPYPPSLITSYKRPLPPQIRPATPANPPRSLLPRPCIPTPPSQPRHPDNIYVTFVNPKQAPLHPTPITDSAQSPSSPPLHAPKPPLLHHPHPHHLSFPPPLPLPNRLNLPTRRAVTIPGTSSAFPLQASSSSPHLALIPPKAASTSLQSRNTAAAAFACASSTTPGLRRKIVDGEWMGTGREGGKGGEWEESGGGRKRFGERGGRSGEVNGDGESGADDTGRSREGRMGSNADQECWTDMKARVRELEDRVLQLEAWIFRRFVEDERVGEEAAAKTGSAKGGQARREEKVEKGLGSVEDDCIAGAVERNGSGIEGDGVK